jgi:hypothetical protein
MYVGVMGEPQRYCESMVLRKHGIVKACIAYAEGFSIIDFANLQDQSHVEVLVDSETP